MSGHAIHGIEINYRYDTTKFWASLDLFFNDSHCVKSVHIQRFSGPDFPAFGLNTEISPNAGKSGPEKIRIRTLFTH